MKRTGLSLSLSAFSRRLVVVTTIASASFTAVHAVADSKLAPQLKSIASTDGTPDSDSKAADAVKALQSADSKSVIDVLSAFDGATKRGRNWLRALAADVADNGDFPRQAITEFYQDRSNDADARYVA